MSALLLETDENFSMFEEFWKIDMDPALLPAWKIPTSLLTYKWVSSLDSSLSF
jgi:hypothetical protein